MARAASLMLPGEVAAGNNLADVVMLVFGT
jgi:hypothetical protein